METLIQDFRYGLRMLLKNPSFVAVAVLTLALGIGANTAIFSVVNAVLLRPLAYQNPEQLIWIWENNLPKGIPIIPVSPGNLMDWKNLSQTIREFTAWEGEDLNLTGEGEPEHILGARVFANFFQTLGVKPLLGRTFLTGEDRPEGKPVVVISQSLWQRRFASDPNILGRSLTMNGRTYAIIGVTPPDPLKIFELWIPLAMNAAQLDDRGDHHLRVFARLNPGVTLKQAQTEMTVVASRLEKLYPATNAGASLNLSPLGEMFMAEMRLALLVLLGAAGLVLLIACANVASLLLARAVTRQREFALRSALGASRSRLIRQLFTEIFLLTGIGICFALIIASWGIKGLQGVIPTTDSTYNVPIPGIDKVTIDGWVLGFTLSISLVTMLVFGLIPALKSFKSDLSESLKEGNRGASTNLRDRRSRNALVVFELAFALLLLTSAGLMIQSFQRLMKVNLGFNPHNLLMMTLKLPDSKYQTPHQQAAFYEQLLHRIDTLPGVVSVAVTNFVPLSGHWGTTRFTVEGHPPLPPGDFLSSDSRTVSAGYFQTMGIPLFKGRHFTEQDREKMPQVVIINQTMARRFFHNEEPLGKRLNTGDSKEPNWWQVVGVVGDIKHIGLDAEAVPEMYRCYLQNPPNWMTLVVRTVSQPLNLAPAVRKEVWGIDKNQPVYDVLTTDVLVSRSVALRRSSMVVLSVFAGLAIILAGLGIYGVMVYSVTQRTREMGIRIALGAKPRDVIKMIVRQGLALALTGVSLGLIASFASTRLLSSLLFGVHAIDPTTFAGVSLIVTGVAFVACYIPARRAAKVDPMVALRYE